MLDLQLSQQLLNPHHLYSALARALYSASVLEQDTVACFLVHHEIRLQPRNTAKPPVEQRSSTQPVQSAYENALTIIELERLMFSPSSSVACLYRSILLTALQCKVVGA
jgi:hypothetical protein